MRHYNVEADLVTGYMDGTGGSGIASDLIAEPDQLRFDGEEIIDPSGLDLFAIDPLGRKRLPQMADPAWPVLDCAFDDTIIRTDDGWRVETDADRLAEAKAAARRAIIARANAFTAPILSAYPEAERAGWDKRETEARTILAASNRTDAIAASSIIRALANAAGENTTATVARCEVIVAKAEQFAAISAAVEVMRDQALAAIEAVEDAADMPAVLAALDDQGLALAKQYGLV